MNKANYEPTPLKHHETADAFDLLIRSKLKRAIKVPPHLKAQLLAQKQTVRPSSWLVARRSQPADDAIISFTS